MSSEQRYYAKGQKDRAAGKPYKKPNDVLCGLLNNAKQNRENKAYSDGHRNANKQAR